ncbi:hypothetical protein FJ366_03245 [Candidatus Dependentiae bacterium]|nr:hypothetical protein [Candidatus Dependentiae bacterium]
MFKKIFFSVAVLAIGVGNVHSEVITFKTLSGRRISIEMDTIANLDDLKQALAMQLGVTLDRVRIIFYGEDISDANFEESRARFPYAASVYVVVSREPAAVAAPAPAPEAPRREPAVVSAPAPEATVFYSKENA